MTPPEPFNARLDTVIGDTLNDDDVRDMFYDALKAAGGVAIDEPVISRDDAGISVTCMAVRSIDVVVR